MPFSKPWNKVPPLLVNENVVDPNINPMKELSRKEFGGGPDEALLKKMDPNSAIGDENPVKAERNKKRQRNHAE